MKNFTKTTTVLLLICYCFFVQAEERSTILLTENNGAYSLEFLNSDNVTALQFDVSFSSLDKKNILKTSCLKGLPKSHTGGCQVTKDGKLRYLIYSNNNSILESGTIGRFNLDGKMPSDIKITNLLMGTPNSKQIKGNVVIDVKGLKPNLRIENTQK